MWWWCGDDGGVVVVVVELGMMDGVGGVVMEMTKELFRLSQAVSETFEEDTGSFRGLGQVFRLGMREEEEGEEQQHEIYSVFAAYEASNGKAMQEFRTRANDLLAELARRHARVKELHHEVSEIRFNLQSMASVLDLTLSSPPSCPAPPPGPAPSADVDEEGGKAQAMNVEGVEPAFSLSWE